MGDFKVKGEELKSYGENLKVRIQGAENHLAGSRGRSLMVP